MEISYKKNIEKNYSSLIKLIDDLSTMYKIINPDYSYDYSFSLDDHHRFTSKCFSVYFIYFTFKLNPFGHEGNHLIITSNINKDKNEEIMNTLKDNNIEFTHNKEGESYHSFYQTELYNYYCSIDFNLDDKGLNRIKNVMLTVLN